MLCHYNFTIYALGRTLGGFMFMEDEAMKGKKDERHS